MNTSISKEVIFTRIQKNQDLLRDFGVERLGLFGSFVRNTATADSDIDLLVELKKEKKTLHNYLSLVYFLEALFGRKVEIVTRESLSPYVGPSILKTVEYVPFSN